MNISKAEASNTSTGEEKVINLFYQCITIDPH